MYFICFVYHLWYIGCGVCCLSWKRWICLKKFNQCVPKRNKLSAFCLDQNFNKIQSKWHSVNLSIKHSFQNTNLYEVKSIGLSIPRFISLGFFLILSDVFSKWEYNCRVIKNFERFRIWKSDINLRNRFLEFYF